MLPCLVRQQAQQAHSQQCRMSRVGMNATEAEIVQLYILYIDYNTIIMAFKVGSWCMFCVATFAHWKTLAVQPLPAFSPLLRSLAFIAAFTVYFQPPFYSGTV